MNSKELAKIFKALSNENRLEIYKEIANPQLRTHISAL
jgi:DNA-binding transcriptional ArsR family regulator